ncbi:MAG: M28 family peptidase [Pseudomonadota bacterium]
MRNFIIALLLCSCASTETERPNKDKAGLVTDPMEITRILAADDMEGRETGTAGGLKAREWLLEQMQARSFETLDGDYRQSFEFPLKNGEDLEGINLVGLIRGTGAKSGPVMVVTAHYDHVGIKSKEIYNGADDNASGVAGALAIADHFFDNPPTHDVIIAFLDAEEKGLWGARAFLGDKVIDPEQIGLNLNLDMISKNNRDEIYAAGTYHTPALVPLIDRVAAAAPIIVMIGHDRPEMGGDDWTFQSDHGPFHRAGIPFIYFGVEDHAEYHRPTDDYQTIPEDFFRGSVKTVVLAAEIFDEELERIWQSASRD